MTTAHKRAMDALADDDHDFFRLSFAVPSLSGGAVEARERTTVAVRKVAEAHAPIAFVVETDEDGRPGRFPVRNLWGRLFAPFRLTPRPEVDLSRSRDGRYADEFAMATAARSDASGWRAIEILLARLVFGARARACLPHLIPTTVGGEMLVGPDVGRLMRDAAYRDIALIGGRLHRAVGDPVWTESPLVPGLLALVLPVDPDLDAMARVRHDFPLAAEALLRRRCERRRGDVAITHRGQLVEVSETYVPTRDDAACCARDFAATATAALLPLLGDGGRRLSDRTVETWFAARDATAACKDGDGASTTVCFVAVDAVVRAGLDEMEAEGRRLPSAGEATPDRIAARLRKAARDCALRREFLVPEFRDGAAA